MSERERERERERESERASERVREGQINRQTLLLRDCSDRAPVW